MKETAFAAINCMNWLAFAWQCLCVVCDVVTKVRVLNSGLAEGPKSCAMLRRRVD